MLGFVGGTSAAPMHHHVPRRSSRHTVNEDVDADNPKEPAVDVSAGDLPREPKAKLIDAKAEVALTTKSSSAPGASKGKRARDGSPVAAPDSSAPPPPANGRRRRGGNGPLNESIEDHKTGSDVAKSKISPAAGKRKRPNDDACGKYTETDAAEPAARLSAASADKGRTSNHSSMGDDTSKVDSTSVTGGPASSILDFGRMLRYKVGPTDPTNADGIPTSQADTDEPAEGASICLPPGWEAKQHTTSTGRKYTTYHCTGFRRAISVREAWELHELHDVQKRLATSRLPAKVKRQSDHERQELAKSSDRPKKSNASGSRTSRMSDCSSGSFEGGRQSGRVVPCAGRNAAEKFEGTGQKASKDRASTEAAADSSGTALPPKKRACSSRGDASVDDDKNRSTAPSLPTMLPSLSSLMAEQMSAKQASGSSQKRPQPGCVPPVGASNAGTQASVPASAVTMAEPNAQSATHEKPLRALPEDRVWYRTAARKWVEAKVVMKRDGKLKIRLIGVEPHVELDWMPVDSADLRAYHPEGSNARSISTEQCDAPFVSPPAVAAASVLASRMAPREPAPDAARPVVREPAPDAARPVVQATCAHTLSSTGAPAARAAPSIVQAPAAAFATGASTSFPATQGVPTVGPTSASAVLPEAPRLISPALLSTAHLLHPRTNGEPSMLSSLPLPKLNSMLSQLQLFRNDAPHLMRHGSNPSNLLVRLNMSSTTPKYVGAQVVSLCGDEVCPFCRVPVCPFCRVPVRPVRNATAFIMATPVITGSSLCMRR